MCRSASPRTWKKSWTPQASPCPPFCPTCPSPRPQRHLEGLASSASAPSASLGRWTGASASQRLGRQITPDRPSHGSTSSSSSRVMAATAAMHSRKGPMTREAPSPGKTRTLTTSLAGAADRKREKETAAASQQGVEEGVEEEEEEEEGGATTAVASIITQAMALLSKSHSVPPLRHDRPRDHMGGQSNSSTIVLASRKYNNKVATPPI
mmetsp:Transcript_12713/g.35535  ORF Transcript_12713/g.35535 Transcript_12713/m.35535 type:complete len:209 (+) Transcript_12713:1198-1824(+)